MRDRGAVVAAGGRDDACGRYLAQQHVREGAPRLERAALLQELELEHQGEVRQPEVARRHLEDRRAPDVGPDHRLGRSDLIA